MHMLMMCEMILIKMCEITLSSTGGGVEGFGWMDGWGLLEACGGGVLGCGE
jgi:hypothetical protein